MFKPFCAYLYCFPRCCFCQNWSLSLFVQMPSLPCLSKPMHVLIHTTLPLLFMSKPNIHSFSYWWLPSPFCQDQFYFFSHWCPNNHSFSYQSSDFSYCVDISPLIFILLLHSFFCLSNHYSILYQYQYLFILMLWHLFLY